MHYVHYEIHRRKENIHEREVGRVCIPLISLFHGEIHHKEDDIFQMKSHSTYPCLVGRSLHSPYATHYKHLIDLAMFLFIFYICIDLDMH
jgi:hypothetical protein